MSINKTDKLLVNRSSSSYYVEQKNILEEIEDTDLLLVNRSNSSYKITGADFRESVEIIPEIATPTIIAPPDGAGVGGAVTYTPKTSEVTGTNPTGKVESYNFSCPSTVDTNLVYGFPPAYTYASLTTNKISSVPVGNGVNVSTSPQWMFYDFGAITGVTVGQQTSGANIYTQRLYGTNDPNGAWTFVNEEANGFRQVSGWGYRYYAYCRKASDGAINQNNASTQIPISSFAVNSLTFLNDKTFNADTGDDMDKPISETFTAGQTVTGVKAGSDNAVGKLLADASGNTMTVEAFTEPDFKSALAARQSAWRSVAYGAGCFVAVSSYGLAMRSTDGINWDEVTPADYYGWMAVTYGGGKFVAMGNSGPNRSMYSTDGITWSLGNNADAFDWNSVVYGGDKFVAVASGQLSAPINYSFDGITWAGTSAPVINDWKSVTYGNGKFVAVGNASNSDQVMYSSDGFSWTNAYIGTARVWTGVTYGNGKFVAVAQNGTYKVAYSTDGINWTDAASAGNPQWQAITYGGDKFIAVAENFRLIMYSTDGISWLSSSEGTEALNWRGITYGDGKYVAVAGSGTRQVMYAPDFGGAFVDGMEVINATTVTKYGPSPDNLELVGSTPTVDPVDGISTWGNATWEVSTDSGFTSPMVSTKVITPGSAQTLSPAERGAIVLDFNTDYYARLSYNATDPSLPNKTSSAVHFKTAEETYTIDDVFGTNIYSGMSVGDGLTVNSGINYLEKTLIWIKPTNAAGTNHMLMDSLRDDYKDFIATDDSSGSRAIPDPHAPDPYDGYFRLAPGYGALNTEGYDYVSYSFRAAPKFFDIVKYDGNGTSSQTIPHQLTTTPGAIIVKGFYNSGWRVYHKELGATKFLQLNDDGLAIVNSTNWNDTEPTDQEFTVGSGGNVNTVDQEYIAYLFADTPGLIKCGTYNYNSAAGTEVDIGFRPQWMMFKSATQTANWNVIDDVRYNENPRNPYPIFPNNSNASTGAITFEFTDNGFIPSSGGSGDVVYIAIAKGGSTAFFDIEAFQAITDNNVIDKYGVDPYTANLGPFGIQRLMNEPVGVTAGYAICEDSEMLCPVQDLSNTRSGLEESIETAEVRVNALKQVISRTAIAVAGYYPLYETEEMSDAAGDGSSHSHTFDGVTYYMPNGVTFYHGNYS